MDDQFPGNANKNKAEKPAEPKSEKKEIQPVVTGKVIKKNKSFGSKFREVFLGMELKSASRYIAADVLLPALRNTIVEATTRGIERLIYGDQAPPRSSGRSGYTNATRYNYTQSPFDRYGPRQREYINTRGRPTPTVRRGGIADIILERREDVDQVLERFSDLMDSFDVVSVADLYDLVRLPSTYVDNEWGWTDLKQIDVQQVREGWLLLLPNPEHLS